MQNTLQHPVSRTYSTASGTNIFSAFIQWCANQEPKRLYWLALALAGHGCFITPAILFIVTQTGNPIELWGLAAAAMVMCLVTNLAALPTRITIPVFLLSLVLDAGIIIFCFA